MDNNQGNPNKNNPDQDNFQRMLALAEFAAVRIEGRRTVEFRIFISYITLLVLALYQLIKQQNPLYGFFKLTIQTDPIRLEIWESITLYGLALTIHTVYVIWQIGIGIAMDNDSYRRNFYLEKTEKISGHPLKYHRKHPNSCRKIIVIENYGQQLSHLEGIWTDWSRMLLVAIPTILFTIVVYLFMKKTSPGWEWMAVIPIIMFLFPIGVLVQKRCRKKCHSNR